MDGTEAAANGFQRRSMSTEMRTDRERLTNFHCHTALEAGCDRELTPAWYATQLGDRMRRAVMTDHGFVHYFVNIGGVPWVEGWMENPDRFDAVREVGNRRLRAAVDTVRDLADPNVFMGIEADMMRDGRLTFDPRFTDEFDVIVCGHHFLSWITALDSAPEREKAWLDYMDALFAKTEVDVVAHPFRWISEANNGQVSNGAIDRILGWAEERGVALELNSGGGAPGPVVVRMLRAAADRGLPVVIGTDAHTRAAAKDFTQAQERLAAAGLTIADLYIPEVEDFIARKGRRHTADSRPSRARTPE